MIAGPEQNAEVRNLRREDRGVPVAARRQAAEQERGHRVDR